MATTDYENKNTSQNKKRKAEDEAAKREKMAFVHSIDKLSLAELVKAQSEERESVYRYTMDSYKFDDGSLQKELAQKFAAKAEERYELLDDQINALLKRHRQAMNNS